MDLMKEIDDGAVDLTVTSPPYDNLRTYNGNNGQWGENVWRAVIAELYRVTKAGGVVVWVVGDATIKGTETGTSFKQALWAKDCGFNLHDTMIYQKAGTGACGSNYSYWQAFDYMFVWSKGRPSKITRIADKKNVRAGAICTRGRISKYGKEKDTKRRIVPEMSVRDNVWRYQCGNNGDDKVIHPAKFPEKLARDHIISWSNAGDTVLDPFMGSGTTGKMAKHAGRSFIGIELDNQYFNTAQKRIGSVAVKID
jgi:site-specific DNA-methyltransferase (adenine-specific)